MIFDYKVIIRLSDGTRVRDRVWSGDLSAVHTFAAKRAEELAAIAWEVRRASSNRLVIPDTIVGTGMVRKPADADLKPYVIVYIFNGNRKIRELVFARTGYSAQLEARRRYHEIGAVTYEVRTIGGVNIYDTLDY